MGNYRRRAARTLRRIANRIDPIRAPVATIVIHRPTGTTTTNDVTWAVRTRP